MKKFLVILGSALMGLMFANVSYATAELVTAEVTFAGPISITPVNQLQFGIIDVALSAEFITIDTADGVSGTGLPLMIQGTPLAAAMTIAATAGPTISILVDNPVPGTGYTLTAFRCKYGAGADTACDPAYTATAVASAALKIGATLTGTNSASGGNADGTFDVTIVYQ
jgi:hypothetical protein